jgi:lipopolysaccharide transport system ATP-binding protein
VFADISFELATGEVLGVIGRNGAGKTTLLNLVGGVGQPDAGSIEVRGRLGALLELGAGSHPTLSGRDNAIIGGIIAGMTRRQVLDRIDDITQFAELEEYIDNPLRTYSSGMQMRLAFSTIVHANPEILLVDEVLSVGDMAFQQKCLAKIRSLREAGCAILLATHDMSHVLEICHRAMWIDGGRLIGTGNPIEIIEKYREQMSLETRRLTPPPPQGEKTDEDDRTLVLQKNRLGTQEIKINGVDILDTAEKKVESIVTGHPLKVVISYEVAVPVEAAIFSISVSDEDGHVCLEVSSPPEKILTAKSTGTATAVLNIFQLDLREGKYFVDVGIYERNWRYAYDYHWHIYPIQVLPAAMNPDHRSAPHRWTFSDSGE